MRGGVLPQQQQQMPQPQQQQMRGAPQLKALSFGGFGGCAMAPPKRPEMPKQEAKEKQAPAQGMFSGFGGGMLGSLFGSAKAIPKP